MTDRVAEIRANIAKGFTATPQETALLAALDAAQAHVRELEAERDDLLDAANVSHKKAHRFSLERDAAQARVRELEAGRFVHIIFDGPPGPKAGRFVEIEDSSGKSISFGAWHERPDGTWSLVIRALPLPEPESEVG